MWATSLVKRRVDLVGHVGLPGMADRPRSELCSLTMGYGIRVGDNAGEMLMKEPV